MMAAPMVTEPASSLPVASPPASPQRVTWDDFVTARSQPVAPARASSSTPLQLLRPVPQPLPGSQSGDAIRPTLSNELPLPKRANATAHNSVPPSSGTVVASADDSRARASSSVVQLTLPALPLPLVFDTFVSQHLLPEGAVPMELKTHETGRTEPYYNLHESVRHIIGSGKVRRLLQIGSRKELHPVFAQLLEVRSRVQWPTRFPFRGPVNVLATKRQILQLAWYLPDEVWIHHSGINAGKLFIELIQAYPDAARVLGLAMDQQILERRDVKAAGRTGGSELSDDQGSPVPDEPSQAAPVNMDSSASARQSPLASPSRSSPVLLPPSPPGQGRKRRGRPPADASRLRTRPRGSALPSISDPMGADGSPPAAAIPGRGGALVVPAVDQRVQGELDAIAAILGHLRDYRIQLADRVAAEVSRLARQ